MGGVGVEGRKGQESAGGWGWGGAFILSSAHGINRLPELRAATLWPFKHCICVQTHMKTGGWIDGYERKWDSTQESQPHLLPAHLSLPFKHTACQHGTSSRLRVHALTLLSRGYVLPLLPRPPRLALSKSTQLSSCFAHSAASTMQWTRACNDRFSHLKNTKTRSR